MDELILGTLFAVVAISAIAVIKAYSQGTAPHGDAVQRLSSGLLLLSLVIAVPLAERFAPSGIVGNYEDNLASMIAVGVALLAGTLLTASGLFLWIREQSKSNPSGLSVEQTEILKMVCLADAHTCLAQLAVDSTDLNEFMSAGKDMMMAFAPYDMLSVSLLDPNATMMRRYSITELGNRVSEIGISLPIEGTFVTHVARNRTVDCRSGLSGIRFRDDAWLSKCGFDSRLSAPIFIGEKVVAVLSFISVSPDRYDDKAVSRASLLADVFAVVVSNQILREQHVQHAERVKNLHGLFTRIVRENQNSEFLQAFPGKVTGLMPMTYCRLSLVDGRLKRLVNLYEHNLRIDSSRAGSTGNTVRFEDIPLHRQVLTTGSVAMINLDDAPNKIDLRELELMFPRGVRSIILVPLQFDGEVKGVLSLGEMRGWDRRPILASDVEFAEMLGICGSLALSIADRSASEVWPTTSAPDGFRLKTALPSEYYSRRLAGPLSSIIGAAELMGRSLPLTDGPLMRCVRTIKRNAEVAVKAFNDFREYDNATR